MRMKGVGVCHILTCRRSASTFQAMPSNNYSILKTGDLTVQAVAQYPRQKSNATALDLSKRREDDPRNPKEGHDFYFFH